MSRWFNSLPVALQDWLFFSAVGAVISFLSGCWVGLLLLAPTFLAGGHPIWWRVMLGWGIGGVELVMVVAGIRGALKVWWWLDAWMLERRLEAARKNTDALLDKVLRTKPDRS